MAINSLDDLAEFPPLPELPPLEDVLKKIRALNSQDQRVPPAENKLYEERIRLLEEQNAALKREIAEREKTYAQLLNTSASTREEPSPKITLRIETQTAYCNILARHRSKWGGDGDGTIQIIYPSGEIVCPESGGNLCNIGGGCEFWYSLASQRSEQSTRQWLAGLKKSE